LQLSDLGMAGTEMDSSVHVFLDGLRDHDRPHRSTIRQPAERRLAAVAPQTDGNRVYPAGERSCWRNNQGVCVNRAEPAPSFRNAVGKLPDPPSQEIANHPPADVNIPDAQLSLELSSA